MVFTNQELLETDEKVLNNTVLVHLPAKRHFVFFYYSDARQSGKNYSKAHFFEFFIKHFKVIHGNEIPFCFDPWYKANQAEVASWPFIQFSWEPNTAPSEFLH